MRQALPTGDRELVQIVNTALADATQRALKPDGTSWLACRPGCTPCCHGVFRISALDAARLQAGLTALHLTDAPRATRIQARAQQSAATLQPHFPGDPTTGLLLAEELDEHDAWDTFADLPEADAACPVLDPLTGTCDLYAARPLTCRIFGPPVQNEGGIGLCELCYQGATEADILHGEMHLQHHALEEDLDAALATDTPARPDLAIHPGDTIIAWAVLPHQSGHPPHRTSTPGRYRP